MGRVLGWLFAFIMFAVVGVAIFIITFDANHYKPQIIEVVKAKTGRDLALDGDLGFSIYPNISLTLNRVALSNAAGFGDGNFAEAQSGQVFVELMPLLQKELKVSEVQLDGLKLDLKRNKQGVTNWADLLPANDGKQDENVNEVLAKLLANFTVAGVSVKDSQVSWQDDLSGQRLTLNPLNLKTGQLRPGKPVSIKLATHLKQNQPSVDMQLDGSTTAKLDNNEQSFSLSGFNFKVRAKGLPEAADTLNAHIVGDVSGNLFSQGFKITGLQLDADLQSGQHGAVKAKVSGNVAGNLNNQQFNVPDLRADVQSVMGNVQASGNLQADMKAQVIKVGGLKANVQRQDQTAGTLNASASGEVVASLANQLVNIAGFNTQVTMNSPTMGQVEATATGAEAQLNLASQRATITDLQSQTKLNHPTAGQVNATLKGSQAAMNLATQQLNLEGMQTQATINHPTQGAITANVSGKAAMNLATQLLSINGMKLDTNVQGGQLVKALQADVSGNTKVDLAKSQLAIAGMAITADVQADSIPEGRLQQTGKGSVDLNWESGKGLIDLKSTQISVMKHQLNGAVKVRDPLANMGIDGNFTSDKLVYPPFELHKATVGVKMADQQLTLTPRGTLFRGGYQGTIRVDTSKTPPAVKMNHKVSQLRSEDLLYALLDDKVVTGALDATADISMVAGDEATIRRSLNGTIDLNLKNGTIRDSNFAQKTKQVVRLFEKERTNAVGEKEVAFSRMGGQWTVKQGVFHTEDTAMHSPVFQVRGNGDVNVVNESLDFKLRIGQREKQGRDPLFAPLKVRGPWSDLKYTLQLDALLKDIAKRELADEKAKLKARLDAEKEQQKARLKAKAEEEKERLRARLAAEKEKQQQKLQEQLQKQLNIGGNQQNQQSQQNQQQGQEQQPAPATNLNDQLKQKEDELKQQLEDKLNDKLKGLFGG